MYRFDEAAWYLTNHWWAAAAMVVWYAAVVTGILTAFENWRFRRIMRRTAQLRKRLDN